MLKEKPSFYAIIPSDVRYSNIIPAAKLLYWEITALADKTWYCYASNAYFSELYWVSEKQISEWIKELVKNDFLHSEIKKEKWNQRFLSLCTYPRKGGDPTHEKVGTYPRKGGDPTHEKVGHINTIINTSIISSEEEEKKEKDFISSIDEAREFINIWVIKEKYYFRNIENCLIDWFLYSEEKWKQIKKSSCHLSFERWLRGAKPEKLEEEKRAYENSLKKRSYIDPQIAEDEKRKKIEIQLTEWKNENPAKLAKIREIAEKESTDKANWNERLKKAFKLSIENREIKKLLNINL